METTKNASSDRPPSLEANEPNALEALRQHAVGERKLPCSDAEAVLPQDLRPGDLLTVTVGPSSYSPISFNSFTVGPYTARVTVLDGETAVDTYIRGRRELLAIEQAEYEAALVRYFDRLQANDRERQRRMPRSGN
jgi:hypothetical protein